MNVDMHERDVHNKVLHKRKEHAYGHGSNIRFCRGAARRTRGVARVSIVGSFVVSDRRVSGWTWDKMSPESSLQVELRLDGQALSSTTADRQRQDLERAGVGTGRYGFAFELPESVLAEQVDRVQVLASRYLDHRTVALTNRSLQATREAARPSNNQPVLAAIGDVQKVLEDRVDTLDAELKASVDSHAQAARANELKLEDIRAALEAFGRQVAAVEVFQARLDAAVAALISRGDAADSGRGAGRGLTIAVGALSLVSCASLVLGLVSVF
jgi:hypothetical protein